jgi:predicted ArsR family transcriptional regulator
LTRSRFQKLLLASPRGRLLDRLRRAPQTVEQLASALAVTGNAVRLHLTALEREGLVRRGDPRRTARRPSHTYHLAPGVETIFCQPYIPFLDQLLRVLARALPPRELESAVRTVGRQLASPRPSGPLAARVAAAAAVIDELGGITEVKTRGNGGVTFVIHGLSCPFDAVVRSHPGVCDAIETLVAEMTQARTGQACHRAGDQPHCVIEVTPGISKPRASKPRPGASR